MPHVTAPDVERCATERAGRGYARLGPLLDAGQVATVRRELDRFLADTPFRRDPFGAAAILRIFNV